MWTEVASAVHSALRMRSYRHLSEDVQQSVISGSSLGSRVCVVGVECDWTVRLEVYTSLSSGTGIERVGLWLTTKHCFCHLYCPGVLTRHKILRLYMTTTQCAG